MASGSLQNYCSDDMDDDVNEKKNDNNHTADNGKAATGKYKKEEKCK